ncbi:MAG: hypothetical protein MUO88_24370 [Desulfobacterales bacterium]|nr:hypothetical protein [Desulfobacterales bacterium]
MEVIALRPADRSRVSNDQAIVAGVERLLAGIDERFLDLKENQIRGTK